MAVEPWIKIRTSLASSPKVVRISSAIKSDRLRVVGGLVAVWSVFDTHSEGGELVGYTPESLDDVVGFPGLSVAMADAEWLIIKPESLALPRFDDHNGASAKRRAEDTQRKNSVRKESEKKPDKVRIRERERALPKGKAGTPPAPAVVDALLPAWERWEKYRKGQKGWTADARDLNMKKLAKLSGDDPVQAMLIVEQAIERTWTGLFALKTDGRPPATPQPAAKTAKQAMAPSETPLERALGYAQQRYERGEFGSGMAGKSAYDEEKRKIRSEYREP